MEYPPFSITEQVAAVNPGVVAERTLPISPYFLAKQ